MNKQEISQILIIAMGIDNRLNVQDENGLIAKVEGWHLALSKSMTYEFAKEAIGRFYSTSTSVIMPANLNSLWRVEQDKIHNLSSRKSIETKEIPTTMPETARKLLQDLGILK
jgi:hypothetical protein